MSIYEASMTNPKKQLEFYKDLSEQLQQENEKYKEVIDNIKYYLEDSANQMSEEASYTLMHFLKEVE